LALPTAAVLRVQSFARIKSLLAKSELRSRDFAGDVYTQATDIEEERNGLIESDSGDLRVPEGLLARRD
jgi:hypothetical protein